MVLNVPEKTLLMLSVGEEEKNLKPVTQVCLAELLIETGPQ